ncbi:hypothetical protein [Kitasatospora sp. NPDC097643]|uniref:hypothetical protein n=1 Tax=Kitasatospora sp. NPDC097643 TaxID=3157230 RepID=UPI00331DDAF8
MSDGQDLVPVVVGALVRVAGGVAGGPGRAVAELVRARLRATPTGIRAVEAIEADPGDTRARAELTAAVTELLATDPAFAQYLTTTELGRPTGPPTVHLRLTPAAAAKAAAAKSGQATTGETGHPDGSSVFSPTTLDATAVGAQAGASAASARRGSAGIIAALALVTVAALVAVGINLGSRPLLQPGRPGLAHAATVLRDPGQAQGILPDLRALPGGWKIQTEPTSGTATSSDAPCILPDDCAEQLTYATAKFRSASGHSVQFTVLTFATAETAGRAFDFTLNRTGGPSATDSISIPRIGDQSAARKQGNGGTEALVRVGTTLLYLRATGPGSTTIATPLVTAFARLLAERSQQAQDGRTPDATAPDPVS